MNRLVFGFVAALSVIVGLLVGTLNAEPVSVDLLWLRLDWPLGLVVLLFFSLGLLLGLVLLYFSQVLPLRLRVRKLKNEASRPQSQDIVVKDD